MFGGDMIKVKLELKAIVNLLKDSIVTDNSEWFTLCGEAIAR